MQQLKPAADLLIKTWARTHGLEYIIARPSNNFGPNQYPEKLIPLAVKQLSRGNKIKLTQSGKPIRTWTHSEDTANACYYFMKTQKETRYIIYHLSMNNQL